MKDIAIAILVLIAVIGAGWALTSNNLAMTRFFAPRYEQVRRETFEQSKAYNQGMIQELQNMQFEYVKAAPEHKAALRSIILHRAADSTDNLPSDLRTFINDIKNTPEHP